MGKPTASKKPQEEMRSHYDFSKGVRGKYRHFIGQKRTIKIFRPDGTVTVEETEPEGVIVLEPDLLEFFPDSAAVNKALRGLVELIPKKTA